jgi:hypothetical protein
MISTKRNSAFRILFSAATLMIGLAVLNSGVARAADRPAPLRALLVCGGCCHDYAAQQEILKNGIESRANVTVDVVFSPDNSTKPPLPIYGNPKYADGYDVVIHDECASDIKDLAVVEGVLAPHKAGIPAVNLHCAMHCYRTAPDVKVPVKPGTNDSLWFDYLGVQSSGHGKQLPIAIVYTDKKHPIAAGQTDWTTVNEELYNNIVVRDATHVIARGSQEPNDRPNFTEAAVVWTNEYGAKKTRVFSTTLGHNTDTVKDPRYLDLVTNGVLWACGKLQDSGKPAEGYGPAK